MKKYRMYAYTAVEAKEAPKEVKLLPLGKVHTTEGDFTVDDESIEEILKYFKERKLDLVIDYEHQTLRNEQAPAAGWITELYKGADALMGKVRWTDKGAGYLKSREYRYLSPVVLIRNKDGKAIRIHSMGMTNTPAITGMFAMVNSVDIDEILNEEDVLEGGNKMELDKLIKALGLPEGATEEQVLEVVSKLVAGVTDKKNHTAEETDMVANSTVLHLLGLSDSAKTEDAAAAIMALKAGKTDDTAVLLELKQKMAKREADDAVRKAMEEGKVAASQKDWATQYALKDPEGFRSFTEKAPRVVSVGKMELLDTPGSEDNGISAAVLKNMGLSQEDIKKYANKEDGLL